MALTVPGLRCFSCGDVIFSRARHDYRSCSCGKIAIDGGFDYVKVSGDPENFVFVQLTLAEEITKDRLYKDWCSFTSKREFGKYSDGDLSNGHIVDVNVPECEMNERSTNNDLS
jgi:hypothetical protein